MDRRRNRISVPFVLAAACLVASALLLGSSGKQLTVHDKAYYASPEMVNFIRPGLSLTFTGAQIAADGTIQASFRLTDPKGLPLDREGVTTPGAVSVSLIAAYIPKGATQYTAYTTRLAIGVPSGMRTNQAGTDSGGVFTKTAEGEYTYTFKTKAPIGFDTTVTNTIGAYASRDLTEFDMGTQYDDAVYNFVPDGSPVTVVRDVVRTATCNKCHDQMAFHGGPRRSVELCVLCHQPQSIDPDSGNTVDLMAMIHRIHTGSGLPSVKAGTPYQIIGHGGAVSDFSKVVFPADVRRCAFCHEAPATQADNMFNPTRAACGSCHDDVNFATGLNHVNLPQTSDNQCASCHPKEGELEFDASIIGGHTIPTASKTLKGVNFTLLSVTGAAPGASPTVTFTIKDNGGISILPADMSRLSLVLAGPNTDYSTYVSEAALKATVANDGTYSWTMATKLPADAAGSWTIGIEGRRDVVLLPGTVKQQTVRECGINKVIAFSVDGSTVQNRRTIVATAKCNGCHAALALHGGNRNVVEQCVLCHNPNNTTTGAGATTVDFRTMVHRIHTGKDLARPYVIGTTSFADVVYPGDRRNCEFCHVNGSEQLPLGAALLSVTDPSSPLNPLPPATAACAGCHDQIATLSHALINTSVLGESCSVCHGPNADKSVDRAHAR